MESTFHMLIYRVFHTNRNCNRRRLVELGLGSGQPKILVYLAEHGGCSQKELAKYFEIDPAAVCRMLDAMEKRGLISRRTLDGGRRPGLIEITEKGLEIEKKWQEQCSVTQEHMLRGFSAEERQKFAEYMKRAYDNLNAYLEEGKMVNGTEKDK